MKPPIANGDNGRDSLGRFINGNQGGPGNPHFRKIAKYRHAFVSAVSEEDLSIIVGKIVHQAKEGDLTAAKIILSYLVPNNLELKLQMDDNQL